MRRYLIAAAAGAALILSGCGSDPAPASSAEALGSSVAAVVPSGETLFTEAQFAQEVRDTDGGFYDAASDEQIVKVAKSMCAAFDPDAGNTWANLIDVLVDSGVGAKEAGGFVTLSTYQYCPDKAKWLPSV